jgi:hypothetical protein
MTIALCLLAKLYIGGVCDLLGSLLAASPPRLPATDPPGFVLGRLSLGPIDCSSFYKRVGTGERS